MRNMIRFMQQQEGATAIEYGLLAALLSVAIIVSLQALGPALNGVYNTVTAAL